LFQNSDNINKNDLNTDSDFKPAFSDDQNVNIDSDPIPSLPAVWEVIYLFYLIKLIITANDLTQVLGPFAIGARELGSDPLSAYGN
jgi:hypothetical protein